MSFNRQILLCAFALTGVLAALSFPVAAAEDALTLRLNDAEAVPGGIVAVVLRTYESQPIGQGQACFGTCSLFGNPMIPCNGPLSDPEAGGDSPFDKRIGSIVFSSEKDAMHRVTLAPEGDRLLLEFLSPSGTINDSDGPLAALYYRLRSDLVPGQRYQLNLDLQDSMLFDEFGNPIAIEARGGELTVRAVGSPIRVSADAGEVEPGRWALVSYQTVEPIAFSEGQVTLVYDESIAAGPPQVVMDLRVGKADYEVDVSERGRVVVTFSSPNQSLNRLPGDLINFYIPTRSEIPPGTSSPVGFEAESSWVLDDAGQPVSVLYEADVIDFVLQ